MHLKMVSAKWWPFCFGLNVLTHWCQATHICVSNLTIIGSDNGLSPGRRQAIIWTNAGILLIGPFGTNFSEILIEICKFYLKPSIKIYKFRLQFHWSLFRRVQLRIFQRWFRWFWKCIWKCMENGGHLVLDSMLNVNSHLVALGQMPSWRIPGEWQGFLGSWALCQHHWERMTCPEHAAGKTGNIES